MGERWRFAWFALAAGFPIALCAGTILYEAKKVEVFNADAEAELALGRQSRQRQMDLLERAERGGADETAALEAKREDGVEQ